MGVFLLQEPRDVSVGLYRRMWYRNTDHRILVPGWLE